MTTTTPTTLNLTEEQHELLDKLSVGTTKTHTLRRIIHKCPDTLPFNARQKRRQSTFKLTPQDLKRLDELMTDQGKKSRNETAGLAIEWWAENVRSR